MPPLPLTERILNDAGGWQAMKVARGLHAAGRVTEATYEDGILRGLVREGQTQYRAGLRIGSKTDIENLCTCRDNKLRGLVCAHSMAVGLEVLKPAATMTVGTAVPAVRDMEPARGPLGQRSLPSQPMVSTGPAPQFFLKIEGSLNYLGAELEARTEQRRTTITSPGYRPVHPAEAAALGRLRHCGFEGPTPRGEWALRGEAAVLGFFARELPALQKVWEVSVGARFEHVTRDLERVTPRFEVQGSGQNWFETGFELATESGERLPVSEIRRLLASGRRSVKLKNQKTAVLDEGLLDDFEELLKDTNPSQVRPGSYRFDVRDAGYLGGFAAQRAGAVVDAGGMDWRSGLPFARNVKPPVLGAEWEILRPYQREGVLWFNTLSRNGLAGVLADEMGLGKTVQTLAFLTTLSGPKLVVCPASLTVNWQREADRFAPSLRACVLADAALGTLGTLVAEDRLLITSYALMRRDLEVLCGQQFAAVVLDEAQQIKNPESQTAQAAHRLHGQARLALTGTPIENGVRDIWSVMQFLMPGYLGSRVSFRERYEIPIRDQPDGPQGKRLVQRLRPFLLRRTKAEVAAEIPEKIEQVAYCELTEFQKTLYARVLSAARQAVEERSGESSAGRSKLAVFTALLRLRQVCCDPRLLGGDDERPAAGHSAKMDLLRELLSEAIEDGHRVLIFSQFSTMLGLIRRELEADGIVCCYLDGSTTNRQAEVDRFQRSDIPVFLISLKAGGFGLNLTAADTVILYDPWWNPAVEAQAADRVHRIGQTRSVNIYRLVAKDSVEEKILRLQAKKRNLAAQLVENDQPLMEGLSFEEVCGLME